MEILNTNSTGVNQVFDIHKTMVNKNIILIYEGEFTQDITKSMLSMAEQNLQILDEDTAIKKRVFNIMVECLQNLVKHAENLQPFGDIHQTAIFMIGKENGEYVIRSGNAVKQEKVVFLKEKLEKINNLDQEGLKNLYKEIIKSSPSETYNGAGLGLVDMARKSGKKLEYSFELIDKDIAFFALQTSISKN